MTESFRDSILRFGNNDQIGRNDWTAGQKENMKKKYFVRRGAVMAAIVIEAVFLCACGGNAPEASTAQTPETSQLQQREQSEEKEQ